MDARSRSADRVPAADDALRPAAIEVPSNRWLIHPAARALLPLAIRLRLHPNTVSLTGLGFGIAAGVAYLEWRDPLMATLGFALMLGWHVCDGLDGMLARATGQASAFGRVLDGLCDYAVFIVVLIPMSLTHARPLAMLALTLASGTAHALQSAWYEDERAAWTRRAAGDFDTPRDGPGWLGRLGRLGPRWRPVDAALAAHPARRRGYLARAAAVLRQMAMFSANARTLAIWLACLAGLPLLYWLWELVLLSLLVPWFAARLRRIEARVAG